MFFDRQIGLHEAPLSILRDGHQCDPLVHVPEIGIETQVKLLRDLLFLLAELRCQRIENCVFDSAIKIVEIDLLQPFSQSNPLLLKPFDRSVMVAFDVDEIFAKRLSEPSEHPICHADALEHCGELLDQSFLPYVGLSAVPFCMTAPVVDVFLLLDIADQRAAAMPAGNHAGEEEIFLHAAHAGCVPAVEHALHSLPQLDGDERLV